jgi:hypothetical protein
MSADQTAAQVLAAHERETTTDARELGRSYPHDRKVFVIDCAVPTAEADYPGRVFVEPRGRIGWLSIGMPVRRESIRPFAAALLAADASEPQ